MASKYAPVPPMVGEWYQEIGGRDCFEVVAVDDRTGAIEIQYQDGTIDELDGDNWNLLPLVTAPPPEDPNAAYGLSADEWPEDDVSSNPELWRDPLNAIDPDLFPGYDDF